MARNPQNGFIYIKRGSSDKPNAPLFKGFISITPELLRIINELEEDSNGNIKLDIALWAKEDQPGVASGNVQKPYNAETRQPSTPVKPTCPPQAHEVSDDLDF